MGTGRTPEQLFRLVSEYEELGIHRTGSAVDLETVDWLIEHLELAGMNVRRETVNFTGWQCDATVSVGRNELDCLAVPYEWQGTIDTTRVAVIDLDPGVGGDISVLDVQIAQAREAGFEAAVCATRHPTGQLRAINRPLHRAPSNLPTFLVAGHDLNTLKSGEVHVRASAQTVPSSTTNVLADNGRAGKHLMLTTPLTGWFTCAGERGTGIAVLVELVNRLMHDGPLCVLATGGHELGHLGAEHWVSHQLARDGGPDPDLGSIMHIGASVGVDADGPNGRQLIGTRTARTSLNDSAVGDMSAALLQAGFSLMTSTKQWLGEAEAFQHLYIPMLSFTGAGVDFHTPNDRAALVTSPASLARVCDAFEEAAHQLRRCGSR